MGTSTWTRLTAILLCIVSLSIASAEPPATQPVAAKPARQTFVRITVVEATDGIVRVGVPIDLLPDDFDKSTVTPVVVATTQSAEEAHRDIEPGPIKSLARGTIEPSPLYEGQPGKPDEVLLRRRLPATIEWADNGKLIEIFMTLVQGEKLSVVPLLRSPAVTGPAPTVKTSNPPKSSTRIHFKSGASDQGPVRIIIPRSLLAMLKPSDAGVVQEPPPLSRFSLSTIMIAIAATAAITLGGFRLAGTRKSAFIGIATFLILVLLGAGIALANGSLSPAAWIESRLKENVAIHVTPEGGDIDITLARWQAAQKERIYYLYEEYAEETATKGGK